MCLNQFPDPLPTDDLSQHGPSAKQNLKASDVSENSSCTHANEEPTNCWHSDADDPITENRADCERKPRAPADANDTGNSGRLGMESLVVSEQLELDFGELHIVMSVPPNGPHQQPRDPGMKCKQNGLAGSADCGG